MPNGNLLLDTHVWVWLMLGDSRVKHSKSFASVLGASSAGKLYLSAISVWEVAMLEAKGRLVFSLDIDQWIPRALAAPGLSLVPLLPKISIESCRLPGEFHGDPADRIIVASARHMNYTLLTADAAIIKYAHSGHCKAIKV